MQSPSPIPDRSFSVQAARRRELAALAALFLRLGATAFGGPAAHIALMEREVVGRRQWLTRDEFLDLLGATNLIPGPNSTEMAMHVGHRRAGFAGLVVAGACFILPAALIVGALGWGYVRFGALPRVTAVLAGIKPVMIAVVALALVALARRAVRGVGLGVLALAAVGAVVAGVNELGVLLGSGALAAAVASARARRGGGAALSVAPLLPLPLLAAVPGAAAAAPFGLGTLFVAFLKMGAILFGSGYVLLAYLRADFVQRLGWLTEGQLLDAVTVGQVTPGPVFTTATFIGYVTGGAAGAALATVAIFLPAFILVAVSGPLVPRLRRSPIAGAFLDGVNVASLALMAVVTVQLGRAALVSVPTVAIAVVSLAVLLRHPRASLPLMAGGALCGWLLG